MPGFWRSAGRSPHEVGMQRVRDFWAGVDRVKNKHGSVRMAAMQRHRRSRGGRAHLALCDGTREPPVFHTFFIPSTKTAPESAVTP